MKIPLADRKVRFTLTPWGIEHTNVSKKNSHLHLAGKTKNIFRILLCPIFSISVELLHLVYWTDWWHVLPWRTFPGRRHSTFPSIFLYPIWNGSTECGWSSQESVENKMINTAFNYFQLESINLKQRLNDKCNIVRNVYISQDQDVKLFPIN